MNALKALFEKIDSIHDEHDVPPETSAKVKEALQNHYGAAVSEGLNSAIDDVIKEKEPAMAKLKIDLDAANAKVAELTGELSGLAEANSSKEQAIKGMESAIDFQERSLKNAFEQLQADDKEAAMATIKAAMPADESAPEKPAQGNKAKSA